MKRSTRSPTPGLVDSRLPATFSDRNPFIRSQRSTRASGGAGEDRQPVASLNRASQGGQHETPRAVHGHPPRGGPLPPRTTIVAPMLVERPAPRAGRGGAGEAFASGDSGARTKILLDLPQLPDGTPLQLPDPLAREAESLPTSFSVSGSPSSSPNRNARITRSRSSKKPGHPAWQALDTLLPIGRLARAVAIPGEVAQPIARPNPARPKGVLDQLALGLGQAQGRRDLLEGRIPGRARGPGPAWPGAISRAG